MKHIIALWLVAWPATALSQGEPVRVRPGVEVWAAQGFAPLAGKRVGLITNPTGVTSDLRSTVDVLHDADAIQLVALFGPEHGVRGDIFAGRRVEASTDKKTGLPVYSLYGKTRKATPEMLKGLDALVYDIQDIGCRSYTYISTMGLAMEAAAEAGIDFVVLDRPDPLGGEKIEGCVIEPAFRSFVSRYEIPYVYGMTCGELAQMINGEGWLAHGVKCKLHVIPMEGWRRRMWFDETGLPWVMTSPHVPTAETACLYAASGILGELGVINEGVGYTLPFHLFGAPWLEPDELAAALAERALPGVRFRPLTYTPYYFRFKDQNCGGVQIYVTDREAVHLTSIQFHVMDIVRKRHPEKKLFGNNRDAMFDKVCGSDRIRKAFEAGRSIDEILRIWNRGLSAFRQKRAPYLLYR
jgi:uncharacterized protein YbbC (DUF1343 family)